MEKRRKFVCVDGGHQLLECISGSLSAYRYLSEGMLGGNDPNGVVDNVVQAAGLEGHAVA